MDFPLSALRRLYRAFLGLLPDEWVIQLMYRICYGRFADLRTPKTFSEKTNWRKLHQRDPRFTLYSDKVAVKDEIARLVGREHVVPTLWVGERPEDIPFDSLEPPYVIKVNHGYGSNIFIRRREDVDVESIRRGLRGHLRHPHGLNMRQWGYYDIPRRIIIERMLDIFGGDGPEDYKFFVYHGHAHFIQVNVDRWGRDLLAFYDRGWNKLTLISHRAFQQPLQRPSFLEEMLEIAEKIGSGFDFVRVDLYHASGTVYFGETTFYHSAGYSKPLSGALDMKFGEPWRVVPYPPPQTPKTR